MYKNFFKRIFDLTFSITAFIFISPIFVLIWACLAKTNKNSSAFFCQLRPGKDEKVFSVIKFRTMNDKKDDNGILLPDSERITKIGSFIRKTSLDEIPQLINVIKGEMSLVGPRPLLIKYLPYYTPREKIRHTVRPGITGWAQVNGRNTLNWNDRLSKDIEYVENMNLLFDLIIIYKTIVKVIKSENVIVNPESIMKNFDDERNGHK